MSSAALECEAVVVAAGGAPLLRGIDLRVPAGSLTALVGPSGAGKTTLVRAVAGLEPLRSGSIRLGERRIDELPAHRREVAVVFQEPRLLPHLDVLDNVAFPLRAAGAGRGERRARAQALLDDVGLGAFSGRRLRGLSGGEQQRIALARALCAEPRLLLLDEPLVALDPSRREALRRLIMKLHEERGVTTLLITHDRAEAAELGDRVALMLEGRIVQHDEPRLLFERPASAAVARFFGMANILRGTVSAGALELPCGRLPVPGPDGPATFGIRPEHVVVGEGELSAEVVEAVYAGTHVRLRLRCGELRLEAHVAPSAAPPGGATAALELPLERLWRLPEDEPVPVA